MVMIDNPSNRSQTLVMRKVPYDQLGERFKSRIERGEYVRKMEMDFPREISPSQQLRIDAAEALPRAVHPDDQVDDPTPLNDDDEIPSTAPARIANTSQFD